MTESVKSPAKAPAAARKKLRCGFSTGTAVTAAARAALRRLLTGISPEAVAVRLAAGYFLPVSVAEIALQDGAVRASVIKDGGDDPDATHKAELRATVSCFRCVPGEIAGEIEPERPEKSPCRTAGIRVFAGEGVGVATKAGLPVKIGEPAINPTPREMLAINLTEELLQAENLQAGLQPECMESSRSAGPSVFLPFTASDERLADVCIQVKIEVPRGAELARRTLNPRLGILGGISILGTTGIVRPFSHKAYEETIQAALSVAASSGCREIILSTGGKSERFARDILTGFPPESCVQFADFFAFALHETRRMNFKKAVLAAFFGKVVKMAQGHRYTHAHEIPLDLNPLAQLAEGMGHEKDFCRELASANTARHALELLLPVGGADVIRATALQALEQAATITEEALDLRLLLFDYDGTLLNDLERPCKKS